MALTSWLYEASFGLEVRLCTLNAQPYDQPSLSYGDAIKDLPPDYSVFLLLAIQETIYGDYTPPIETKDPRVRSKSPRVNLDHLFGIREHKGLGKKKAKQAAQQSGGNGGDDDDWGDTWNITSKKKDKRKKKEKEKQLAKEEEKRKAKEEGEKKTTEEAVANTKPEIANDDDWGWGVSTKKKDKKKKNGAILEELEPVVETHPVVASPPPEPVPEDDWAGWNISTQEKKGKDAEPEPEPKTPAQAEPEPEPTPEAKLPDDPLYYNWDNFSSKGRKKREKPLMKKGLPIPGKEFAWPPPPPEPVADEPVQEPELKPESRPQAEPKPQPEPITLSLPDDPLYNDWDELSTKDKRKREKSLLKKGLPIPGKDFPWPPSPPEPLVEEPALEPEPEPEFEPEPVPEEPEPQAKHEPEPEPESKAPALPDDPLYNNWDNLFSKDREKRERSLIKKGLPIPGKDFEWPPQAAPVAEEPVQEPVPEVIPEPVIDANIRLATVTVLIGPRGRFYTISRSLPDKIPSLYSLLQTNPTREEHNTCKTITLSDVDERIGHTLMHYLYTGDFQVQKASSNSGTPKQQVYYAQSVLAYCTATKYSLSGLQDHAKGFMEAFGPSISIHDIVDLAREVYSRIGEDLWYLQHLTARIQAAFDADDTIFSEERFLNGFGEGSPLDKFLVRIMTQAFYTTIGSILQNP
ncbi:unnamed protein product [Aspergillus oryzae]|nr:unnamed protein product [Aspergillus oryzae]GMF95813.1 unnamed protein product [Aspergillus oryzae]